MPHEGTQACQSFPDPSGRGRPSITVRVRSLGRVAIDAFIQFARVHARTQTQPGRHAAA
jgi:hypothetical protein